MCALKSSSQIITLCSKFAQFSLLNGYLFENFNHVFVQLRALYIFNIYHCLTTSFRPSEVKLRIFVARRQNRSENGCPTELNITHCLRTLKWRFVYKHIYEVYETLCWTLEYLGIWVNCVNKSVTTLCPWWFKGRVH